MSAGASPCSASTRSAVVSMQMSSSGRADHVRKEAEAALREVPEGNLRRLSEAWLARDEVDMEKVREHAKMCVSSLVASCADSAGEVLRLSVSVLQSLVGMQVPARKTVFQYLHSACERTEAMYLQGGSLAIAERPVCEHMVSRSIGFARWLRSPFLEQLLRSSQPLPFSTPLHNMLPLLLHAAFARSVDFFLQGCMGIGLR